MLKEVKFLEEKRFSFVKLNDLSQAILQMFPRSSTESTTFFSSLYQFSSASQVVSSRPSLFITKSNVTTTCK